MSRTHRPGGLARVAASTIAMALIVVACGGDDDVAEEPAAAPLTAASEPVADSADADAQSDDEASGTTVEPAREPSEPDGIDRDARLVYATTNPVPTLDPHAGPSPSTGHFPFIEPVYDRLIALGPDMTLEPMLATDWAFSDDGLTFTLHLRKDAVFSDGAPLTAEAVKLTIERLMTPDAGYLEANELVAVESVEAVDDHTVAFHLNFPDAALPYALASAIGIVVSPNAIGNADLGENPVGIGPYVVSEFVAGDRVRYERNPEYYDPSVQNFAEMEIRFIVDDNARLNGLRSGELDIVYISPAQVTEMEQLAASGDFGLHRAAPWGFEYIWLNLDVVPDRAVREAMMLALDREAISEALFGGDCAVSSQPQAEGMIGHDPSLEELYAYDPDRAAEIVAGLPELPTYTMAALASSPNREMAIVIEQQLEAVGFELEITNGDSAAQFGAFAQGLADGVPGMSASAPYFQGAILNPTFMALSKAGNHASDEILALNAQVADATISDDERAEIITEINRRYTEELLSIIVCRTGIKAGFGADIVGVDDMRFPISRRVHDVRHLAKVVR